MTTKKFITYVKRCYQIVILCSVLYGLRSLYLMTLLFGLILQVWDEDELGCQDSTKNYLTTQIKV